MRKLFALLGVLTLAAMVALPDGAARQGHESERQRDSGEDGRDDDRGDDDAGGRCGKTRGHRERGYEVIFDGSRKCFERWRYSGGLSITLQRDGTLKAAPGPPNLGVLWYAARPYGDFSLRLQFRDDSPVAGQRANSGVQVRFPAPRPPVPGCPMTFNGGQITDAGAPAWIAVNCGHEIQINDNEGGDARKTGSIYGFKDLDRAASRPTPAGVWNDLEI